jgi:hypothetical protein
MIFPLYLQAALTGAQPSAFNTRLVDAGLFTSFAAGRIGRRTSSPPQLGHVPESTFVAQSLQ